MFFRQYIQYICTSNNIFVARIRTLNSIFDYWFASCIMSTKKCLKTLRIRTMFNIKIIRIKY